MDARKHVRTVDVLELLASAFSHWWEIIMDITEWIILSPDTNNNSAQSLFEYGNSVRADCPHISKFLESVLICGTINLWFCIQDGGE